MRTSASVSESRLEASSESAVMLASRSRTGVSLVDSDMGHPFVRRSFRDEAPGKWWAEYASPPARAPHTDGMKWRDFLQTEIRSGAARPLVVLASGRVAVTDVPFELVGVKLAPPSIRPGTVAKVDVIARLSAADARLATVVAPAGYGKTTLLARWAESDPRAFAWVSLDGRDDDDPRVFLRYVAAALSRVGAVSTEVLEMLSAPRDVRLDDERAGGRGRDGRDSSSRSCSCWTISTSSTTAPVWTSSRSSSATFRAARRSRSRAARRRVLPLARWRSQGWVQEIGVSDLRLDEQEAGLLLEAVGVELDPTHARRADRANGGLAVRPVPRCALATGRSAAVSRRSRS